MGKTKESFMQDRDDETQIQIANKGLAINEKSFLRLDKASVIEMAQAVVEKYTDGHNSAYEGLLIAKKLIDLGEAIKDNIKDSAANELKIAKGEKRSVAGTTVTEQMTGVRYSFKECGDPTWNELNEKIKERESFLKTIKGSKQELIEATGELVQIFEPVKSGSMGLIIKY